MMQSLSKQFQLKRLSVLCPSSLKLLGVHTDSLGLPQNLSITKLHTSMRISFQSPANFAEIKSPPSATHYSSLAKTSPSGNLFVCRLKEPNSPLDP